jgi:prepilin-type N-terminal cleavage/methylation domain-containing protein
MRMRHGFSFVEILISTAILGLAMAPVIGMISKTFSQLRQEKTEALAANYAGKLLNQVLFEATFAEAQGMTDTPTLKFDQSDFDAEDGCRLKWKIECSAVPNLKFEYKSPIYHPPHAGGEPGGTAFNDFNKTANDIDKKMGNDTLLDVKLTIQWRSPGEAYNEERKRVLFTRKARLE